MYYIGQRQVPDHGGRTEPEFKKSGANVQSGSAIRQLGFAVSGRIKIGSLQPFTSGLQSYFPALSTLESQLVSFPAMFEDFLDQLEVQ